MFVAILSASCTQDMDIRSNQGYLSLRVNSLTSTVDPGNTRAAAPDGYNAKTLRVEIQDQNGKVVKSTDDFNNDKEFKEKLVLEAGSYTVIAHSANWDGSGSGFDTPFYYGSTRVQVLPQTLVTASVTCTLNNVKVTVNYDQSFKEGFKSAVTTISSPAGVFNPLEFKMNVTNQSGYIPVGSFNINLAVVNKGNVTHSMDSLISKVKARDHYILNFKVAESGNLGDGTEPGINVEVDESTNTYTFTFEVPKKSAISLVTRAANAWSNFAMLNAGVTAKTEAFDSKGLTIRWRESGATEWNEIANDLLTIDDEDNVSATLKGLAPKKTYEYALSYVSGNDEVVCDPVTFTTEDQTALYNGGFEMWHKSGSSFYPNESSDIKYWDTSNPGSTTIGDSWNVTTQETDPAYVYSGTSSAKLSSKYVVVKFAAASLYTGTFGKLNGTKGATLNWGVPFTSRPTSLKGVYRYSPGSINRGTQPSGAPAKGSDDMCQIYCVLTTKAFVVDNTDAPKYLPNFQTDTDVVAYGTLPDNMCQSTNNEWVEFDIPLVYNNLTTKPTHLIVVCSSSKYGDYFYGSDSSVLYLDDFSLEYGDTPSVR